MTHLSNDIQLEDLHGFPIKIIIRNYRGEDVLAISPTRGGTVYANQTVARQLGEILERHARMGTLTTAPPIIFDDSFGQRVVIERWSRDTQTGEDVIRMKPEDSNPIFLNRGQSGQLAEVLLRFATSGIGTVVDGVKTVMLLRHAEFDLPPNGGMVPDSTPLNATGRARARSLARLLGSAGITAIFTSEAVRTQQTAEPLAQGLGLQPKSISSANQQELVQQVLSDEVGSVVLIVGHSPTVPEILRELGTPYDSPYIHGHDDLFIVTVFEPHKASMVQLKYGTQTFDVASMMDDIAISHES